MEDVNYPNDLFSSFEYLFNVESEFLMSGTDQFPFQILHINATPASESTYQPQMKQQQSPSASPQIEQHHDDNRPQDVFVPVNQANTESLTMKKKTRAPRQYVPEECKNEEYRLKRQKNTEASRKCRAAKKIKFDQTALELRLKSLRQKEDELKREYLETHGEAEKVKKALELNWNIII